jgi:hypothetical protein
MSRSSLQVELFLKRVKETELKLLNELLHCNIHKFLYTAKFELVFSYEFSDRQLDISFYLEEDEMGERSMVIDTYWKGDNGYSFAELKDILDVCDYDLKKIILSYFDLFDSD